MSGVSPDRRYRSPPYPFGHQNEDTEPESVATVHASTHLHDFAYHTIAFPVSSAGGDTLAMRIHRQEFPTPRGSGKRDPKGGRPSPPAALPGGCDGLRIAARRAPGRMTSEDRRMVREIVQVSTRQRGRRLSVKFTQILYK